MRVSLWGSFKERQLQRPNVFGRNNDRALSPPNHLRLGSRKKQANSERTDIVTDEGSVGRSDHKACQTDRQPRMQRAGGAIGSGNTGGRKTCGALRLPCCREGHDLQLNQNQRA